MKEMMTIATFNERPPAELLEQRVEAAGIEAEIVDESDVQKNWFLSKTPLASVRVRVNKSDYDRTKTMVMEWDAADGALKDAIRCPECGSSRIEFPQFTRKFLHTNAAALAAKVGIIPLEFFCEECQFTWLPEPEVKPDLDVLNWPKSDKML